MKYQAILYEKQGAVAKVMTNRPRYKNAQSRLVIEEMDHAFATANADVRVIILVAVGDTFSSGHDIGTAEEKEASLLPGLWIGHIDHPRTLPWDSLHDGRHAR